MLCRMETVGTTKVERNHESKGEFRKVGENLYRYSSSGKYYAVFRVKGKLFWKSLGTADREHAKRNLKDEQDKQGKVDPDSANIPLTSLLELYEKRLQQFDEKTIKTRTWILNALRKTWKHSFFDCQDLQPSQE